MCNKESWINGKSDLAITLTSDRGAGDHPAEPIWGWRTEFLSQIPVIVRIYEFGIAQWSRNEVTTKKWKRPNMSVVEYLCMYTNPSGIYMDNKLIYWGDRDPASPQFNDLRDDHLYYVVYEDDDLVFSTPPRAQITQFIPPLISNTVYLPYTSSNSSYYEGTLSWYKDAGDPNGAHRLYGPYPRGHTVSTGCIEFDFYTK